MVPVQLGRYCCCKLWSQKRDKVLWQKMKYILSLIKKIWSPDCVGDLSQHRLHTTKYEDLCK